MYKNQLFQSPTNQQSEESYEYPELRQARKQINKSK